MSDLNDFFAKKDRKKKRAAAAKTAQLAAAQNTGPAPTSDDPAPDAASQLPAAQPAAQTDASAAAATGAVPTAQPKNDDGWIEIEDLRGSQVNTGGRTVVEFRRDVEEKEPNGESTVQSEKFSGWNKNEEVVEPEVEKEETPAVQLFGKQPASAPFPTPASFPTLADAAKVRQVAPTQKPSAPAKQPERQRPRLVFDKEKLRKKLEENAKQGA